MPAIEQLKSRLIACRGAPNQIAIGVHLCPSVANNNLALVLVENGTSL
jgi:hypothetical protein